MGVLNVEMRWSGAVADPVALSARLLSQVQVVRSIQSTIFIC